MTFPDFRTRKNDAGDAVVLDATSIWNQPRFMLASLGIAVFCALLLVLRAYLPRWIFGAPTALSWISPAAVFVSYIVLGIATLICMRVADLWLSRRHLPSLWQSMLIGSASIIAGNGVAVACLIGPVSSGILPRSLSLLGMWTLSSALGTSLYMCLLLHRASAEQRALALHVRLESDLLDTALARAELSMIEAQIEPHFLFNTLAHVKRQYRADVAAADLMLARLIDYLERASPALQRVDWTVGDELGLVQVYLDILTHRFGERLQFSISASDAHRSVRLPALTVATLVENAVRHGVSPKPEGGCISVAVETDRDTLLIEVRDNGVGLRQSSGTGLGLATVRARLRSAFGQQATLLVEPLEPSGVRAAISIPQMP